MVRSHDVFGQNDVTVISQPFHVERALYIAHDKGWNAIGFAKKDVSFRYGLRTQVREKFARVKMMLDLLLGVEPKFRGDPVHIG